MHATPPRRRRPGDGIRRWIDLAAALAGIGGFVVALITLIVELR